MSLLAALRHCQSRAARMAAAVFAVGWLGFAVAPCQAMNPMPDEAPHHGTIPMDDCGHCPPATDTAPDCADAEPVDCFAAAQPAIELRQAGPPKPVAVLPAIMDTCAVPAPAARPPAAPRTHAAPLPHASLQQRYCSYLK
ncbi:MAG TPA: hypothetical protein VFR29_03910 [Steroidobacteraceae bacterium]|nr:hypothetical protein [Steroidobacteraceae bacterium]